MRFINLEDVNIPIIQNVICTLYGCFGLKILSFKLYETYISGSTLDLDILLSQKRDYTLSASLNISLNHLNLNFMSFNMIVGIELHLHLTQRKPISIKE